MAQNSVGDGYLFQLWLISSVFAFIEKQQLGYILNYPTHIVIIQNFHTEIWIEVGSADTSGYQTQQYNK